MNRNNNKYIVVASLLAILFLVIIPLIIHILFSTSAPSSFLEAKWSAGDFLQFYGSIISAIIAIIGIAVTIKYTQKNYHDDVLKNVLPFLCVEIAKDDSIKKDSFERDHYMNKIFFIVNQGVITSKNKVDTETKEILRKCNPYDETIPGNIGVAVVDSSNSLIPLIIENTGNGTAVGLNMKTRNESVQSECTLPINIRPSERFYIYVIFVDYKESPQENYYIDYSYYDIYNTKYKQTQKISKDAEGVVTTDVTLHQNKIS